MGTIPLLVILGSAMTATGLITYFAGKEALREKLQSVHNRYASSTINQSRALAGIPIEDIRAQEGGIVAALTEIRTDLMASGINHSKSIHSKKPHDSEIDVQTHKQVVMNVFYDGIIAGMRFANTEESNRMADELTRMCAAEANKMYEFLAALSSGKEV